MGRKVADSVRVRLTKISNYKKKEETSFADSPEDALQNRGRFNSGPAHHGGVMTRRSLPYLIGSRKDGSSQGGGARTRGRDPAYEACIEYYFNAHGRIRITILPGTETESRDRLPG